MTTPHDESGVYDAPESKLMQGADAKDAGEERAEVQESVCNARLPSSTNQSG